MSHGTSDAAPLPPLDLNGLPLWLLERGMLGLRLDEQIAGFCQKVFDSGFPMKWVQMGMYTLHPRYGSHTFVWRPGADATEHTPRERAVLSLDVYLKGPVRYMRSRALLALRRRLDRGETDEFLLFPQPRAEGLVDYVAHIVLCDP